MTPYKLTTNKLTTLPEHDGELELDTLACIVWNVNNYSKIMLLEEEDFYTMEAKDIFNALKEGYKRDKVINLPTINKSIKGTDLYLQLTNRRDGAVTTQVKHNIKELKAKTASRKIQKISHYSTIKVSQGDNPDEVKAWMVKEIDKINSSYQKKDITTAELEERFDDMIDKANDDPTTSGFPKLDRAIGGFSEGTMTVVAAAPGVGKTTMAINLLYHFCKNLNRRVLYVTLEMNFDTLYLWLVSRVSGVPYFDIRYRRNEINKSQWSAITNARAEISKFDQIRMGEERITIDDIRYKIKEAIPDVVIIDYLQKIKNKEKFHSEYEGVTNISNELSTMANEFNVPIVTLSSLSRRYTERPDGVPRISDMRGSGVIEHDAETVFLLHRESAFGKFKGDPQNDTARSKFERSGKLLIAKNRHGISNKAIDIYFDGAKVLIREAEEWEI